MFRHHASLSPSASFVFLTRSTVPSLHSAVNSPSSSFASIRITLTPSPVAVVPRPSGTANVCARVSLVPSTLRSSIVPFSRTSSALAPLRTRHVLPTYAFASSIASVVVPTSSRRGAAASRARFVPTTTAPLAIAARTISDLDTLPDATPLASSSPPASSSVARAVVVKLREFVHRQLFPARTRRASAHLVIPIPSHRIVRPRSRLRHRHPRPVSARPAAVPRRSAAAFDPSMIRRRDVVLSRLHQPLARLPRRRVAPGRAQSARRRQRGLDEGVQRAVRRSRRRFRALGGDGWDEIFIERVHQGVTRAAPRVPAEDVQAVGEYRIRRRAIVRANDVDGARSRDEGE
mmetsp:Transcript_5170/g.20066  ORF Transcript_5170/g.20066 Transcript_5170/m.20066 type:complete len:347 (+) Transcript_5170:2041-3081(+)